MHWQIQQFNVLNDLELVGRCESLSTNFSIVDFINKRCVDTLRLKPLAELALVTLLAAGFGFPAAIGLLFQGLDDVARRRL